MDSIATLHTHNTYCDGKSSIEDMVRAAIDAGLTTIGISSHAPLPFQTDWTMKPERLGEYLEEVRQLASKYAGRIRVLAALEGDFIPDERVLGFHAERIVPLGFDYFIGSVHFLGDDYPPQSFDGNEEEFRHLLDHSYRGDVRAMVEEYYARVERMAEAAQVRIVGHIDRIKRWNASDRYFREDASWYVDAVARTLDTIERVGEIVELNTSGWRNGLADPYPSPWILALCRDKGIPVIVTADAHRTDEVTWGFDRAARILEDLGIDPVKTL